MNPKNLLLAFTPLLIFTLFTAQYARAAVPERYWVTRQFIGINRRASTAWGLAVVGIGASRIVYGIVVGQGETPSFLLSWGLPILLVLAAVKYTSRITASPSSTTSA